MNRKQMVRETSERLVLGWTMYKVIFSYTS